MTLDEKGNGSTDIVQGHYHQVNAEHDGDKVRYVLGPPRDLLTARVPLYATNLRFKDRTGKGSERGINVGNEWKYRSFIEGGSLAAATFTFDDITPETLSRRAACRDDDSRVQVLQGRYREGHLGKPGAQEPQDGPGQPADHISSQGLLHR